MSSKYEVGYGKPPKHSRFRKGRSGNPSGRPKGTKNLRTDLHEELNEKIAIREGASERQISKQRALVKSLLAQAIKGDTRASSVLVNMILRVLGAEPEAPDESPLSAEEREILKTLERRLERTTQTRSPKVRGEVVRRGGRRGRPTKS